MLLLIKIRETYFYQLLAISKLYNLVKYNRLQT
jgi:hypothetical protein